MVVAKLQIKAGYEKRICFVGRRKRLVHSSNVLERCWYANVSFRALPITEQIGRKFGNLFVVKVANNTQGCVGSSIKVFVKLFGFFQCRRIYGGNIFLN